MVKLFLFSGISFLMKITVFRTKHNTKYNIKPPGFSGRSAIFLHQKTGRAARRFPSAHIAIDGTVGSGLAGFAFDADSGALLAVQVP